MTTNIQQESSGKVVYILGAGFSKPAGAPSQAEILEEIFKLESEPPRMKRAQNALRDFLKNDLRISIAKIKDVALEDIYTPIDRCIADGTSLKSKTASNLVIIRGHLECLIATAITRKIENHQAFHAGANAYITDFARHLVDKAAKRAQLAKDTQDATPAKQYDPFSVISLNWDILLDNALHKALQEECGKTGDYDPFGVVDYCCYISSVDPGDSRIRSGLWSLGCKGYNVKLLKLHGSMNWLQCPNCQRLFVQFGNKQEIQDRIGETRCRHCQKCGYENYLSGSLVMPTFLKDLSNFQLKLVWQNAGVELLEAKRLVFIGYSLPNADYEFRQLLSRMVHPEATITVVLHKRDGDEADRRLEEEKARYRNFFGKRTVAFDTSGVDEFVKQLTSN